MKHTIILSICLLFPLINTFVVFAEDGYFGCDSDSIAFNSKEYRKLYIKQGDCSAGNIRFESITVTDMVVIDDPENSDFSVSFIGSNLNQVQLYCSNGHRCELGLDGSTTLKELELYSTGGDPAGVIMVNGLPMSGDGLPAFHSSGYLCEGQPEFEAYSGTDISIDFQLHEVQQSRYHDLADELQTDEDHQRVG